MKIDLPPKYYLAHFLELRGVLLSTKAGMKKHYPGLQSYGLKNLILYFGINLENHHRALADAEAAASLLV